MNFTTSLVPQVYNITLKASDPYLTIYKSYQFETQNTISLNLNTDPINIAIIVDDGSKILKYFINNF